MKTKRTPRFLMAIMAFAAVGATSLAAAPVFAQEEPTTAPCLPPATEIIANYVEAIGGEDAIKAITSRHIKGKLEIPGQGMSGDLNIYGMAPNLFHLTIMFEGMGEVQQGYDGTVAWMIQPGMGASIMEDEMLDYMKHEADFHADLHFEKNHKSMETVGMEEFAGAKCYVVKMIDQSDIESTVYFDAEKGLMVGQKGEAPMGPGMTMEQIATLSDYAEYDGVMLPRRMVIEMPDMGMEQILTTEEIIHNKVEKSQFDLPAEIKALVDDDG